MPFEKRLAAVAENRAYLVKLIGEIVDYFDGDVCIYGHDHIGIAEILWDEKIKNIPFILLEDGLGNYFTKKSRIGEANFSPSYMHPGETSMGHNDRTQEIYLTGMWKIPNDLKGKVKILDIRTQWEKKTTEQKDMLLSLYQLDRNIFNEVSSKTICFLGGNFSRFGIVHLVIKNIKI